MARLPRHATVLGGQPQSYWGLVEWRAAETPDALFVVDEHRRRVTFAELRDMALRVAAALHERGIRRGTVVGWQLPTRIESFVLTAALARIGAVQVPMLPPYREREVGHVIAETKPAVVFVPGVWRDYDYAALAQRCGAADVAIVDRELPESDAIDALPDFVPEPDAIRWIYYTSGTTGRPKGAQHTDATFIWAAHSLVDVMEFTPDDRGTLLFPVTHVGGPLLLLSGFIVGHAHIASETFGRETIELLREEGVTIAGSGTSFQLAYLAAQREHPDEPLFPRIRAFGHGGDMKRDHIHDALRAEIGGVGIISGYGMTEMSMIASGAVSDPPEKLRNRIGRICPGVEVKFLGPDGQPVPPGTEGVVWVRGPSLFKGYVDSSLDADAFDEDGFFNTGDIGFIDADGYVEITGRQKDIIIRKGENVSAGELEELLHHHPAVAEVAVVGVPDEDRGEMVCAVVVPNDPEAPPSLEELRDYLLGKGLMIQKCPERLEIRPALPRDFLGKPAKVQLRQELS